MEYISVCSVYDLICCFSYLVPHSTTLIALERIVHSACVLGMTLFSWLLLNDYIYINAETIENGTIDAARVCQLYMMGSGIYGLIKGARYYIKK